MQCPARASTRPVAAAPVPLRPSTGLTLVRTHANVQRTVQTARPQRAKSVVVYESVKQSMAQIMSFVRGFGSAQTAPKCSETERSSGTICAAWVQLLDFTSIWDNPSGGAGPQARRTSIFAIRARA